MLRITENKGFQLTFENGITISVQFGYGDYCENRNIGNVFGEERKQPTTQCNNAEIAIWDENNIWFNFGSDEVKGWCESDEVADWINATKNALYITDIKTPKSAIV